MRHTDKEKKHLLGQLESLRLRIERLKKSEIRRKQAEKVLRESEKRFRVLFENSPHALVLAKGGRCIDCNGEALRLFGCNREQVQDRYIWDFSPEKQPDGEPSCEKAKRLIAIVSRKGSMRVEWVHRRFDGREFYAEVLVTAIPMSGEQVHYVVLRDISDRKENEGALKRRELELEEKSRNLEKINTALEVLVEKREEDIKKVENSVFSRIEEFVLPYVEKLKKCRLNGVEENYLNTIETNLKNIMSPFIHDLASKYLNLTHKEIQVANLIKEGKTTKEIAELLNASARAIEFHRNNLRNKLGLKKQKASLQSYFTFRSE